MRRAEFEGEDQAAAIRALGDLFKLTEVFIWDNGTTEIRQASSTRKHIRFEYDDDDDDDDGGVDDGKGENFDKISSSSSMIGCDASPEDMDLTQQMSELGLPISFSSNKEERIAGSRGKKNGKLLKNDTSLEKIMLKELFPAQSEAFVWDNATAAANQTLVSTLYDGDRDGDDRNNKHVNSNSSFRSTNADERALPEDMDLTQQRNELGFPAAFCTNKNEISAKQEKRNGRLLQNQTDVEKIRDVELASDKASDKDNLTCKIDQVMMSNFSCAALAMQNKVSCCSSAVEFNEFTCSSTEEGMLTSMASEHLKTTDNKCMYDRTYGNMSCVAANHELSGSNFQQVEAATYNICTVPVDSEVYQLHKGTRKGKTYLHGRLMDHIGPEDSLLGTEAILYEESCTSIVSEQSLVLLSAIDSSNMLGKENVDGSGSSEGWKVVWDSFYSRNFFYNVNTQESTWDAPHGMENLVFVDIRNTSSRADAQMGETNAEPVVPSTGTVRTARSFLDKISSNGECHNGYESFGQPEFCFQKSPSLAKLPPGGADPGNVGTPCELDENCQAEVLLISEQERHDNSVEVNGREIPNDGLSGSNLRMELGNGLDSVQSNFETICHADEDGSVLHLSKAVRLQDVASREDVSSLMDLEEMAAPENEFDAENVPAAHGRKKKARKTRSRNKSLRKCDDKSIDADIEKYWCQRYSLFSKFDCGIKMDVEGWFSATPELIGEHQASRCGGGVIIDGFAGVGGNAIQFAKRSKHVVAIDIDQKRIEYAQHNAGVYGVEDQIDFVTGDSILLAPKLKAETVFLSPPWGGPDYSKVKTYDIAMLKPCGGQVLFHTFRDVASKMVMFLPRNIDINQLAELALSENPPWSLEVEKNFLNGKLKGITAYFCKMSV